MVFQCINIRQVPWEVLKTAAFGLGFQHLPRDLANVNAWKTMFDPYIEEQQKVLQGWCLLMPLQPFDPWVSAMDSSIFELGHIHCCIWGYQSKI